MTTNRGPVRAWFDDAVAGWNRFWFTPSDPATLCLIRVLAGAMLFYTHLVWGFALVEFFGEHGWLAPDAARAALEGSYSWSYLWWCRTPALLWIAHVAALTVFALLTVGLFSRATSILAFIATASYVGRAHGALFGLDQINLMLAMYLLVGPCGEAWSLDAWRRRRALGGQRLPVRPSVSANLAVRLIQVHLCVIYLFAGTGKLMGPAWWDGTAMWKAIASLEYQSLDMTWLAEWPRLINALTHLTVFWEVFYCALIWPRFTRPIMLVLAIPLHLGIAFCLGMMTFGLVMLIANLAFVPPESVRALLERAPARAAAAAEASSLPVTGKVLSGSKAGAAGRRGIGSRR